MKRIFTTALLCSSFIACGDSTGIAPDDIDGTWTATSFMATNPANPAESEDFLAAGGSFTITFRADGTFTSTTVEEGVTDTDTGTYTVSGSTITIAESGSGSPTPVVATRDGNTMTLTWSDDEIDWNDDGTDDPAYFEMVIRR